MVIPTSESWFSAPLGSSSGSAHSIPHWAPAAGQIKIISHAAGAHPNGPRGGAVLAEIDPSHQPWNPAAPGPGPYGGTSGDYFFGTILAYGGSCFNADTRQLVCYGAGHAAFNVPAPFAFDLNDLTWKWLDVPLPIDGLDRIRAARISVPPRQADVLAYYPAAQYDYAWGDWNGSYPGWPKGFGRPGKIQPNPGHSRARLVHIPATSFGNGKGALFWNASGTGVLSGVNARSSHLFDYDALAWARAAQQIPAGAPGSSGGSAHDPISNKVILVGSTGPTPAAYLFDVVTKSWTIRNASNGLATSVDHGGNVLHSASGLYIVPGSRNAAGLPASGDGTSFQFFACPLYDIVGNRIFGWSRLNVSAAATWPLNDVGNNNYIGWAYCPEDGCLYTINGIDGSTKYWKLAPPGRARTVEDWLSGTWKLSEHVFRRGSVSSPKVRSFVFNRLSWDPASRSFIWFSDNIHGPVQAFRPEGV